MAGDHRAGTRPRAGAVKLARPSAPGSSPDAARFQYFLPLHHLNVDAGLSAVRKRFHQFADGLDEHLRDRAERPILQGGDADWLSRIG